MLMLFACLPVCLSSGPSEADGKLKFSDDHTRSCCCLAHMVMQHACHGVVHQSKVQAGLQVRLLLFNRWPSTLSSSCLVACLSRGKATPAEHTHPPLDTFALTVPIISGHACAGTLDLIDTPCRSHQLPRIQLRPQAWNAKMMWAPAGSALEPAQVLSAHVIQGHRRSLLQCWLPRGAQATCRQSSYPGSAACGASRRPHI